MPEIGQASFQEAAVASSGTCDIGATDEWKVEITGTTTITSFGAGVHRVRFIRFSGTLTLTHNGTSLILPGAANITTAAGDTAIAASDGSGNWRVFDYTKASGLPVATAAAQRLALGLPLESNGTAVANSGTGETDLMSYTLAAGYLDTNGRGFSFEIWWEVANNANTKTVRLYFGGQLLATFSPTTSHLGKCRVTGTMLRSGSNTQAWSLVFNQGASTILSFAQSGSLSLTEANTQIFKLTGQSSAASDDITQRGMVLRACK